MLRFSTSERNFVETSNEFRFKILKCLIFKLQTFRELSSVVESLYNARDSKLYATSSRTTKNCSFHKKQILRLTVLLPTQLRRKMKTHFLERKIRISVQVGKTRQFSQRPSATPALKRITFGWSFLRESLRLSSPEKWKLVLERRRKEVIKMFYFYGRSVVM